VMEVIAHKPVDDGGLGAAGLEGRVGIDHARGGVEPGIGNPRLTNFAIVSFDILEEELNRVVGVGAFVEILGTLVGVVWAHIEECPLGHPAAPDILVNEDEAFFLEMGGWPQIQAVVVNTVRRDAVGRPVEHERESAGGVLGDIHGCEQLDPIAHRDLVFVLGVIGDHMIAKGLGLLGELRGGCLSVEVGDGWRDGRDKQPN